MSEESGDEEIEIASSKRKRSSKKKGAGRKKRIFEGLTIEKKEKGKQALVIGCRHGCPDIPIYWQRFRKCTFVYDFDFLF